MAFRPRSGTAATGRSNSSLARHNRGLARKGGRAREPKGTRPRTRGVRDKGAMGKGPSRKMAVRAKVKTRVLALARAKVTAATTATRVATTIHPRRCRVRQTS